MDISVYDGPLNAAVLTFRVHVKDHDKNTSHTCNVYLFTCLFSSVLLLLLGLFFKYMIQIYFGAVPLMPFYFLFEIVFCASFPVFVYYLCILYFNIWLIKLEVDKHIGLPSGF